MPSPNRSQQRLALSTYIRLLRAANAARNFAAREVAGSGLTLTQFAVLEALYHLGPMSLTDIARKILTTGGNLTMVLGNLEKRGLAHRQESPQDGRVQIAVLAPKGKQLMHSLFPRHAASLTEFLGALTPSELKQLSALCRKLEDHESASVGAGIFLQR